VSTDDKNSPAATAPAAEVFKSITVSADHAGKRLDRFLVDAVPDLSRARVKSMIDDGQVKVNGRRARKGDAVGEGVVVELLAPPPPRDFTPIAKDDASIVSRFDDADVVVLEKPAGMPTHPLRPDETGTLANVIVARWPATKEIGFARREPGLLHRLDTDTSGLVIVAKTAAAFGALRDASRDGKITKRYLALVEGNVAAEGRVDYPLVPHRKDPKRVEAVTPHVRLRAGTRTNEAHTRYRPVRALHAAPAASAGLPQEYTLVEVELETAFRHQVRVHLATVGHPLLGDTLYRGPDASSELGLTRHFLHATEVIFPHPRSGEATRVTSALPKDLSGVVDRLRAR
jgi:23S rRNA pseudouridine1911/1915/1917 synthase